MVQNNQIIPFSGKKSLKLIHWSAVGRNIQGQPIGLCTLLSSTDCHRLTILLQGESAIQNWKVGFLWKDPVKFRCLLTEMAGHYRGQGLSAEMRDVTPPTGREKCLAPVDHLQPKRRKVWAQNKALPTHGWRKSPGGLFVNTSSVADVAGWVYRLHFSNKLTWRRSHGANPF